MNGSVNNTFRDELNRMEMFRPDEKLSNLYFVSDKDVAEPHIRVALEQAENYSADAVFFRIFPAGDHLSAIPFVMAILPR